MARGVRARSRSGLRTRAAAGRDRHRRAERRGRHRASRAPRRRACRSGRRSTARSSRTCSDTRFGTVWGIRMLVWLGLRRRAARRAVGRPPARAAAGLGGRDRARAAAARAASGSALLALPLGFLVISPALAGHASLESPTAVLIPANIIHVLAMSIWVGGLATAAVRAAARATRRLEPPDRTRLLAATLARFSPWAFASVIVAARHRPGAVVVRDRVPRRAQAAARHALRPRGADQVRPAGRPADGARRVQPARGCCPRLRRARGARRDARAATGFSLRRSLRTEVALLVGVLGVTAALVSIRPADYAPTGPGLEDGVARARRHPADGRPGAGRAQRDARLPDRQAERAAVRQGQGDERRPRAARRRSSAR